MAAFRPRFSRHTAVAGLALLAALVATTRAWSQGHTPDPYNFVGEYNRGYEPYMFPAYPNDQGASPARPRSKAARVFARPTSTGTSSRSWTASMPGMTSSPRPAVSDPAPASLTIRRIASTTGIICDTTRRTRRPIRPITKTRRRGTTSTSSIRRPRARSTPSTCGRPTRPGAARLYREYLDLDQRANPRWGRAAARPHGGPDHPRCRDARCSLDHQPSIPDASDERVDPRGLSPSRPHAGSRHGTPRLRAAEPVEPVAPRASGLLGPSSRSSRTTPSDILRRSELMDRANRGTTSSTARNPVPRPVTSPAPADERVAPPR